MHKDPTPERAYFLEKLEKKCSICQHNKKIVMSGNYVCMLGKKWPKHGGICRSLKEK